MSGTQSRIDDVERKSWFTAALFLLASLPFRSVGVTAGVVLGFLLAIVNFRWLRHFVNALLAGGRRPSKFLVLFYTLKYVFSGLVIYCVIRYNLADVFGILAGVSVVFLAICWDGIVSHRKLGEETNHATEF